MGYRIKIELAGLPRMANSSGRSSHWRALHQEAKKWQQTVVFKVGIFKPAIPLKRARLTLIRFSSMEPDYDGLVRGFKSIIDGFILAKVLENDRLSNTGAWNCHWERCPKDQGKIIAIVEDWV